MMFQIKTASQIMKEKFYKKYFQLDINENYIGRENDVLTTPKSQIGFVLLVEDIRKCDIFAINSLCILFIDYQNYISRIKVDDLCLNNNIQALIHSIDSLKEIKTKEEFIEFIKSEHNSQIIVPTIAFRAQQYYNVYPYAKKFDDELEKEYNIFYEYDKLLTNINEANRSKSNYEDTFNKIYNSLRVNKKGESGKLEKTEMTVDILKEKYNETYKSLILEMIRCYVVNIIELINRNINIADEDILFFEILTKNDIEKENLFNLVENNKTFKKKIIRSYLHISIEPTKQILESSSKIVENDDKYKTFIKKYNYDKRKSADEQINFS